MTAFKTYGNIEITGFSTPTQTISVNNDRELNYDTYDPTDTGAGTGAIPTADIDAIYEEFTIEDDVIYKVHLNKFSPGIGNIILWISTADDQNMYAQKLSNDQQNTFYIKFINSKFADVRIGILFHRPYRGDFFRLNSIDLSIATGAIATGEGHIPQVSLRHIIPTVIDGNTARYNIETGFEHIDDGEIVMTVGVPIYNAADILWLALDSLVQQTDIDFNWELILFEEGDASKHTIQEYIPALQKAGCTRILYKTIRNKITLLNKWLEIAKSASPSSKIFVMQSADDYSPPRRLATHRRHFADTPECYLSTQFKGLFYNLQTHEKMFYVGKNRRQNHRNCAYLLEHFRQIRITHTMGEYNTNNYIKKSIDAIVHASGKLRSEMKVLFADDDRKNEHWKGGFFTDGFNTASAERQKYYATLKAAKLFYPYESYKDLLGYSTMRDYLPAHLFERLLRD